MVKAVKRFLALFLTAVMAVTFFPQFSEIISVTAYAEQQLWDKTSDKNGCSVITTDKKVYYGNTLHDPGRS